MRQKQPEQEGAPFCTDAASVYTSRKLLGIPIEPEKDIILTLIHQDQTKNVLKAIVQAGQLEKPGTGIGFVIDVDKVVGIVSLLEEFNDEI